MIDSDICRVKNLAYKLRIFKKFYLASVASEAVEVDLKSTIEY